MKIRHNIKKLMLCGCIVFFLSCTRNYVPKPYGYYRVDLPDNLYSRMDTTRLPYSFDMGSIAQVQIKNQAAEKYWIDIVYPDLDAIIHCSYTPVQGNLSDLWEDAHRNVYKHQIRADEINASMYENQKHNTYGVFYDIKGNAASSAQLVLTDSTQHFFRGALYFNHTPNKDSIAPMADFIKRDMIRLMESFTWK